MGKDVRKLTVSVSKENDSYQIKKLGFKEGVRNLFAPRMSDVREDITAQKEPENNDTYDRSGSKPVRGVKRAAALVAGPFTAALNVVKDTVQGAGWVVGATLMSVAAVPQALVNAGKEDSKKRDAFKDAGRAWAKVGKHFGRAGVYALATVTRIPAAVGALAAGAVAVGVGVPLAVAGAALGAAAYVTSAVVVAAGTVASGVTGFAAGVLNAMTKENTIGNQVFTGLIPNLIVGSVKGLLWDGPRAAYHSVKSFAKGAVKGVTDGNFVTKPFTAIGGAFKGVFKGVIHRPGQLQQGGEVQDPAPAQAQSPSSHLHKQERTGGFVQNLKRNAQQCGSFRHTVEKGGQEGGGPGLQ